MNLEHSNNHNDGDNKLRAVKSTVSSVEPSALMDCGDFSLLISSKDIVTLMSAQKIMASTMAHTCGALEFEQNTIPVFAFNKALQLQSELSSAQMTLVIIQYESYWFALCCSALEKLEVADLVFYEVPLSMRSRKQPFSQFAVVNKRAAGLTSAADLWQLLRMRNAIQAIPQVKTAEWVKERVNE